MISVAVVLVGIIGGMSVYLIGAKQRRDDRATYLAYERDLLVPLREGGRVVQLQMKPSLREARAGELDAAGLGQRAEGWRLTFVRLRSNVAALEPPAFLADVEAKFLDALDAYRTVAEFSAAAGGAPDAAARDRFITEAESAGERADDLFDRASGVMQFHRRRLGLGATTKLPGGDVSPRT